MFVYKLGGFGFESQCSDLKSDIAPVSSKEFVDIRATIEYRLTLKHIGDMVIEFFTSTKINF